MIGRAARAARSTPAAAAPASARLTLGHQHLRALGFARALKPLPPLTKRRFEFAAVAAQPQEIVAGAESRVLEQSIGAPAGPLE